MNNVLSKPKPSFFIREIADERDISAVYALAKRIWNDHYPGIISASQINYMLELMYAPPQIRKQRESGHQFFLLEENDTLLGYASAENQGGGKWFLHKLYVDRQRPRSGLGTALLSHVIANAQPKELALHVNRKNIGAINFYFRHGFFIERLQRTDIGEGYVMDDFVMRKIL